MDGSHTRNVCAALWSSDLLDKYSADGRKVIDWVYYVLTIITAALSIAGSLTIIILYNKIAALQTAGRRMLVYLSVSDLLVAAGNLIGVIWYVTNSPIGRAGYFSV